MVAGVRPEYPIVASLLPITNLLEGTLVGPDQGFGTIGMLGRSSGARVGNGLVDVESQARTAQASKSFGAIWFDRIHIIPAARDLGFILSDTSFVVGVWNAFLDRSNSVTAINVEGTSGLTVTNPFGLPTHYPASEYLEYQINVLASGDPFVENRVVWVFAGIDPNVTDLIVEGQRVVPFPFMANMEGGGIRERFGFLTDVRRSWRDNEQRIQLKSVAKRALAFDVLTVEARESEILNVLLFNWQSRPFGVPVWHDAQLLTAPISIGATQINVVTTDMDFEVGGLCIVWKDPYLWDVFNILTVNATNLVTTTQAARAWDTVGTLVIPVRLGRLTNAQELEEITHEIDEISVDFDIDAWRQQ